MLIRGMHRDQKHGKLISLQLIPSGIWFLRNTRDKIMILLMLLSQVLSHQLHNHSELSLFGWDMVHIPAAVISMHWNAIWTYEGGWWAAGDEPMYYVISPKNVVIEKLGAGGRIYGVLDHEKKRAFLFSKDGLLEAGNK